MVKTERYWHGGVPGLKPGDLITPRQPDDKQHLVDGCRTCEARRGGKPLARDDNDPSLVYVTTERDYARIYAAGYPRGALYVVEPLGELTDRTGKHDPAPSWGCAAARVLSVYDRLVVLSDKQARSLDRRYRIGAV
ncbi:hypothetical protein ACIP5Y_21235 [Nocardia sp. NPDC088792]|uniref:hypothetical protein n=1 Tax=Nocardia sp. NPDC088792 TaxID=3364332 RepID=UPI0037FA008F